MRQDPMRPVNAGVKDHRYGRGLRLRRHRCAGADGYDHSDAAANEIGCERRQSIILILRIHVLALFLQTWRAANLTIFESTADWALRNPTTGIAACARATAGHAAVLPSPTMNSRRRILDSPVCRSLPRRGL